MRIQASHPILREFFGQLRFAPNARKKKQLAAAEQLMMVIDTELEYPFDFIVYRITGYRPPAASEQVLIPGQVLIADLRVWVSRLSEELELDVAEQPEPVLTVNQLAQRFSVSPKTIRRWEKRGLTGKIYVFQDGRKRKGFTESAVQQFAAEHPNLIHQAGRFTRLDSQQKQEILLLATQLASEKKYHTRNELVKDVAKQVGRVRQTVRVVLAECQINGAKDKLPASRGRISAKGALQLYKLNRQGVSIKELMERFGRSRSSVHRIINQQRARELFSRKIEYMGSDEFTARDAEEKILSIPLKQLTLSPQRQNVLLSRQQETILFRRYNYLKFLAAHQRQQIQRDRPRAARIDRIEKWLNQAETVKKSIIEANMPLVVSIAGKHLTAGVQMSELVSEGSIALMAAVEKFDYTRGYRFSTYASWAIVKDFARMIPAESKRPDRASGADFSNLPSNIRLEHLPDVSAVEQAQRNLRMIIENNLDEREQYIILNHYALDPAVIKKKPMTLKQIGDELSLSKERIRQIELQALQKLRQSLSPEQFDLLTG
ncbi:MAG: sigma-70 family RNA polymerase sigma factor [Phycisphaerae bacterium]|nr:sigma-70 family RNA polymerase sigma factor [Phycisphaerae bacterium]